MTRLIRLFCIFVFGLSTVAPVSAQNLGTGLYAFGSFDSRGFDTINLGNLNTHFEIPIVSKKGRGINFDYSVIYDGLVWSTITSAGLPYWQPQAGFGFQNLLNGITGVLTFNDDFSTCMDEYGRYTGSLEEQYNFVYQDPYGKMHPLNYSTIYCSSSSTAVNVQGDGTSSDGSGYYLGLTDHKVHDRNGGVIDASVSSDVNGTAGPTFGNRSDPNGNMITNNGDGTFTDTLGVKELTISGSGTATSPISLSYPVTLQANGATTATAVIYYKTYTVQTNFQCGVTEYGATSFDLTDHITLADGSTYSFTYEPTPGVSGAVTGRLASITLPTGGVISYAYSAGCAAGINADGTGGTLTRATSDGTRIYARGPVNANASSTLLQDEKGNQTQYQFTTFGDFFYETHRQVYQGAIGGTPLLDQSTCYNGITSSCDGIAITSQISQIDTLASYNGGSQIGVNSVYNPAGMLISSTQTSGGTALESVYNSYNTLEELTNSTTEDGSGTPFAYSYYGYDETAPTATSGIPQHSAASGTRGNQTSAHVSAGATYLNTATTYYDTGAPITVTTPNGTTQYSYDPTQTFATATMLPTPSSGVQLATSASYDQQSGAVLSVVGMNPGQTTQVTQYDSRLRPIAVSLPNGGQVNYAYDNPNQSGVTQSMGNDRGATTYTLKDGYGRLSRIAVYNGQSNANSDWYQVDYCYDAAGLLQFQSVKYAGGGFVTPKQCSGNGTSYVYDALGRATSITNPDGTATAQYLGKAVKTTDVNGVQKITQYDPLGRISGICEISSNSSMPSSGSPVSCGMDISGTGFLTNYSYNLASNMTTITQGAQQRIFQSDPAGRTTSVTEPERGTTSYSYAYNSTGLVVTRTRPQANQSNASVLTTTTTQYDSLGRVVTVTYNDGLTANKQYDYDAVNSTLQWTQTPTNIKGMLADTASGSGSNLTRDLFSYDVMGHVTTMWQCAPSICGTSNQASRPALSFSYDLAGNLTSEFDGASGQIVYGRSPAGEVTSITNQSYVDAGNPPNLVSNVVNSPYGPTSFDLGNGTSVLRTYGLLGQFTAEWLCPTSGNANCNAAQIYGSASAWKGQQVYASCDTVIVGCQQYGFDEFNRLTSVVGQQNFSYAYDRYGNRTSQSAPNGGPAPTYLFNPSNNQILQFSYDAAGNLTNDGIHSYTYDAEGNILQVDGGSTAQYVYDALNRRVRVQTSSSTNEYLFDYAGRRISTWLEPDNFGNEGRIYWDNQQIAFRSHDGTTYFDQQDTFGTERMRTNYSGQIVAKYTSLPFGDGYSETNVTGYADQDNLHYAQLDQDSESGTDHAQFRQYSNMQGRWMSPDPYDGSYHATNPQSFNRYTYVMNRPLSAIDPTGLDYSVCSGELNEITGEVETVCYVYADPDSPGIASGSPGCISDCGDRNPSSLANPNSPFAAPSNVKPTCLAVGAQHVWNAIKSTFDPTPSLSGAATALTEAGAATASNYMNLNAQVYAATATNTQGGIGLITPLRSSTYRGILAQSADLARVAASAVLVGLDVNLGIEIYDEIANSQPCR